MKKKILVIALLLVVFAAAVSAQSADALTRLIEADKATVGDIAYFLAVYRGSVSENATATDAIRALQEENICSNSVSADNVLTYKVFAGMLMRTWNVRGGLMYTLTKSDRYALRDLQAKGFISSGADPVAAVSGYEALAVINDCMTELGGE